MGRIFLCWTVSQAANQIRRFLDDKPFSLKVTIGSVVLMSLNSPGAIEDLSISSIYSGFVPDGVWVAVRHAWVLLGCWCRDQVGKGGGLGVLKGINDDRG